MNTPTFPTKTPLKKKILAAFSYVFPALIVIFLFAILSGGIFAFNMFEGRIATLENKLVAASSSISELEQNLAAVENKGTKIATEAELKTNQLNQELTTEKSKRALLEAQQASSAGTLVSLEKSIKESAPNISKIVSDWQNKMAIVSCKFTYKDTGAIYLEQRGSGTLNTINGSVSVTTNKHVVLDEAGFGPSSCSITLAGTVLNVSLSDIHTSSTYDLAEIIVQHPSSSLIAAAKSFKLCSIEAKSGDQVAILGFPGIGSGLTTTEGIISGYDGDYYVTSAKVDQGDSGGAVILSSDDCYVGIPTFVKKGGIEALARILKSSVVF